ncbi:hypothetical protein [Taibaiella koreensis]|uniref:hypothetical protein n=1 Tax=Taibaiella koreensis TaxID=1268548 RepID=UPI0013C2BAED|nr:hypothetical protein [Taibaiella koreensis]
MLIWRVIAMIALIVCLVWATRDGNKLLVILCSVLLIMNAGFLVLLIRRYRAQNRL